MAMNTWAAIDHGKVETIGLCHGVQHGWRQIAEALGADDPHEVEYICSGINHQTWYIDIRLRGRPVGRDELDRRLRTPSRPLQAGEGSDRRARTIRVLFDREQRPPFRVSCRGTASGPRRSAAGSTCPIGFTARPAGTFAIALETRNWFETDFPRFLDEAKKPIDVALRTDEHASHIIEALETGRPYRGHFNVKNNGVIANLASDAIVESPGFVDQFGVNMAAT